MAEAWQAKVVVLPPTFDLDTLDTVRDGLIEAVELGGVTIDGGAVERVATNALLMLVSAAATARRNGNRFTLGTASRPMLQAIERLGFEAEFAALTEG